MMAKARLRRGIDIIKLANRIEQLKVQDDDEDFSAGDVGKSQTVSESQEDAKSKPNHRTDRNSIMGNSSGDRLSKAARGAILREVVLAKVREMKQEKEISQLQTDAANKSAQA